MTRTITRAARRAGRALFGAMMFAGVACSARAPERAGVRDAYAPEAIVAGDSAGATMAVYLTVVNPGPADTVDAISTPIAAHAAVHEQMDHGGMGMMMPVSVVDVPARGALRLAPGARHLMLESLSAFPRAGDQFTVTLRLRHGGNLTVTVPVIRYAALDSASHANAP